MRSFVNSVFGQLVIMTSAFRFPFVAIALTLLTNVATAQNQELQRKYKLENATHLLRPLGSDLNIGSFNLKTTSVHKSMDLYFDTPDLLLFKNNMSLRFRKVVKNNGKIEYKLQLKDEMVSTVDSRLEVDENNLVSHQLMTAEGLKSLTEILDTIFRKLQSQNKTGEKIEEVKELDDIIQWVKLESDGFIEPFQVLADLNKPGLSSKVLSTLRPIVFIQGIRNRLMVYADTSISTKQSKKIENIYIGTEEPPLLAECSLDNMRSTHLLKNKRKRLNIIELEIENKQDSTNLKVMDLLEADLKNHLNFKMNSFLESKYHQSIKYFGLHKR